MNDNTSSEKTNLQILIDPDNITSDQIEASIYHIRGKQVMLDSDLAILFQVETKRLNESVRRNSDRFPSDFCFQLSKEEYADLRSQIATSSLVNNYGGRRYRPWVFTEHGVAMLSAVLKSKIATEVSVRIIRSFVEMRRFLADNSQLLEKVRDLELRQMTDQVHNEERFEKIFGYLESTDTPVQKIFYEGQIYDAFSLLVDLIKQAKSKIVLVDGYVDTATLDILSKKNENVEVCVYTKSRTRLTASDISAFNAQYPKLQIYNTNAFHDRYLLIDNQMGYLVGASLKDAGKKSFAITKIMDNTLVSNLCDELSKIN